jgi:hypothetical protein
MSPRGRVEQPHQHGRGGGLAAAGFSHQSHALPFADGEGDALDRMHGAGLALIGLDQIDAPPREALTAAGGRAAGRAQVLGQQQIAQCRAGSRGRVHQLAGVGVARIGEELCRAPVSTIRPSFITASRSQYSAASPRSWVIRIDDIPASRIRSRVSSITAFWVVMSSPVVGSSAINSAGRRRAQWQSPRAGTCLPTARTDRH